MSDENTMGYGGDMYGVTDPEWVREQIGESSPASSTPKHPDHPVESFEEEVDMSVISAPDKSFDDDPDVVADGGYEHERFFESNPSDVDGTASEYGVDVSNYGDELIAVRGRRAEVNEFVMEVRQAMGREVMHAEIERGMYDVESTDPVKQAEAEKAVADGGVAVPSPVNQDPRYEESGEPFAPGTSEKKEAEGMPYGGFASSVESTEETEEFMGDFPM